MRHFARPAALALMAAVLAGADCAAQTPGQNVRPEIAPREKTVNLTNTIERKLRYRPEGLDFVITNGGEIFNRSLYGTNTGFRADAGDRPQFAFWLPRRGGNLRVGLRTGSNTAWLDELPNVTARYRAGGMEYDIPVGGGVLHLDALMLSDAEGLILRAQGENLPAGAELFWAYGGADLAGHSRNADIGTNPPPDQFFRFDAQRTQNDRFVLDRNAMGMIATSGTFSAAIVGLAPQGSNWMLANGNSWNDAAALLASAGQQAERPVATARAPLAQQPVYAVIARLGNANAAPDSLAPFLAPQGENAPPTHLTANNLAQLFAAADAKRVAISGHVVVETPDPYINAAAAALNVVVDGIWDEPAGIVMHGAVAWRSRYLGWRGVYGNSYLGWQDRAKRNFRYWAALQNTNPIPDPYPGADPSANLARSERALHTNGIITHSGNSHYDMNLVFFDGFFRYLRWTGDLELAREMWPMLMRHLEWEKRNFRRPYGPEGLPLYEAYTAIWASDDLQYHGSGTTHATAYNYYHNLETARLAQLLGHDPAPFRKEAELIRQAMERELWLPDLGIMAEYRDLLGPKEAHASPALWTFYHTVDSEAVTPRQAWQMTRYIDDTIPHIPVRGPGVPDDDNYYVLASSNWMPYTYSINNVVLAEVIHTALGYWQTGRSADAFRMFKGSLLAGMFMNQCPGNAGMCLPYDAYRGESQRDFGDPAGTLARAFVEGLYGLNPDVFSGELRIRPGFPARWDSAGIRHPDVSFSFKREGLVETYTVEPRFPKPLALRLQAPALRDQIARVTVNGRPAEWKVMDDSIETPLIEITAPAAAKSEIVITWQGEAPAKPELPPIFALGALWNLSFQPATLQDFIVPGQPGPINSRTSGAIAVVQDLPPQSTWFARLQQGVLRWMAPVPMDLRAALEIIPAESQPENQLVFNVRNNTEFPIATAANVRLPGRESVTVPFNAPAYGEGLMTLPADGLLPGTQLIEVAFSDIAPAYGDVTNWRINAPAGASFAPVALDGVFNEQVTNIFRQNYASPRSPYTSLALPTGGIGSWVDTNVAPALSRTLDDSGLRAEAAKNGGRYILPDGVPFTTPTEAGTRNIVFVSQWDNFPKEITVPLSGSARHAYFLMAGSTNWMQSRHRNGEVAVTYADGSTATLVLENPTTWWPIQEDYYIDDFQFRRPEALPPRVNLASGQTRILDLATFKGKGGNVSGGAATVLDLPLDPAKELRSLTVRASSNEVVIGLMAATLVR